MVLPSVRARSTRNSKFCMVDKLDVRKIFTGSITYPARELFTPPPLLGWYTPLLTLTHTPKLCSPIGGVYTVVVVYSYTA